MILSSGAHIKVLNKLVADGAVGTHGCPPTLLLIGLKLLNDSLDIFLKWRMKGA